jgi:hypothetical protein
LLLFGYSWPNSIHAASNRSQSPPVPPPPPGTLVTPYLVYLLQPPTVTETPEAPKLAAARLKELGPLRCVVVVAWFDGLVGWLATGATLDIREIFARGAVRAAHWVKGKSAVLLLLPPGLPAAESWSVPVHQDPNPAVPLSQPYSSHCAIQTDGSQTPSVKTSA